MQLIFCGIFFCGIFLDSVSADCIWYGQCGINPLSDKIINCAYNGKAIPLQDAKSLNQLSEICPQIVDKQQPKQQSASSSSSVSVCCSSEQIQNMVDSFWLVSSLLGRCPSCLYNFRMSFCAMTCSPDQSDFLEVTKTYLNTTSNATSVQEISFYVKEKFAQGVFDSCKDVVNPSTSGSVFDLLCGTWGELCTPQRLFDFLGDLQNQNTPFQINFKFEGISSLTRKPFDPKLIPCNEAPPSKTPSGSCSCTDCELACVPPIFEQSSDKNENFELYLGIGIILFFVAGISTFLGILKIQSKSKIHPINSKEKENKREKNEKSCLKKFRNFEGLQNKFFFRLGLFCSSNPIPTLIASVIFIAVCSSGIMFSRVTTDPIELWSSPQSQSRIEMDFYENTFSPFYRISQVIVKPVDNRILENGSSYSEENFFDYSDLFDEKTQFSSIFRSEFMIELLKLKQAIEAIEATSEKNMGKTVKLKDVCHQPLAPEDDTCNVQSVWSYWQDNEREFWKSGKNPNSQHNDTYLDHFLLCIRNPTLQYAPTAMGQGCFSKGGIPVQPYFVLGGIDSNKPTKTYANASSFTISILLDGDFEKMESAFEWELAFINFMKNWSVESKPDFMDVSFFASRSIQDELYRSSFGDVPIIVISYSVMLVYIIFSLGKITAVKRLTVEIKFTLSIFGTILVLLSILSAVGIFGFLGLATTLIIFQILPFLVLAVGVDNIFILIHTMQKEPLKVDESHCLWIARVVGQVAPSMMVSTFAQATAFFLGALSEMPAVRAFSLYAAVSLFFNFCLQITAFVAFTSLDFSRQLANRHDVFCCIKSKNPKSSFDEEHGESLVQNFFSKHYVPGILSPSGRPITVFFFFLWTCLSVYFIPQMHIGLEQELAMPDDSFVLKYLTNLKTELSVGPPIFFVVNSSDPNFDYSSKEVQNRICGGQGCNPDSFTAQIKLWSKQSNTTFVAAPSQSWMDDFFDWAKHCCKKTQDYEFCSKDILVNAKEESEYDYGDYGDYGEVGTEPNDPNAITCSNCQKAFASRPNPDEFKRTISWFLLENPSKSCPKAGKAAYQNALSLDPISMNSTNDDGLTINNVGNRVRASTFFTFHTVLRNSDDFSNAMKWSRKLSANLTKMLSNNGEYEVNVFPYSFFYVFYEQYLTMQANALKSLGLSLFAVFSVVFLLSGFDVRSAGMTILIIFLVLINLSGVMVILGISLNAISLVNLVMTVGISVEFCSHLISAFATSEEATRMDRAKDSLTNWGVILFMGVHLTNLIGISVLAFAKSQIFNIYYFQMYISVVIIGALHGLVLLPVLLSYFG